MRFEWDEDKRRRNVQKHGIDFVGCQAVFEGYTLTLGACRLDYGERRYVTIGMLEGRCVSVIHTETDDTIRIISIRKATRNEQTQYRKAFPPHPPGNAD